MDIKINLDSLKDLENSNFKIDAIKFQKMLLLYNSIEQGKKEVLEDTYLLKFMKANLDFNKIVS